MVGVLKIYFNDDYAIPFSRSVVLQNSEFDKYVGTYSGDLPFKVVCKKKDEKLIFEVAGKTLEAETVRTFKKRKITTPNNALQNR